MNAALSAVVADPPAHGTLTLDADGSFTYHPEQDYAGPDTFTYQAGDGEQTSATTTVTLTIQAVNDAPVISSVEDIDLSMNTVADPIAFTVNDIDSDISGLAISATADNASLLPESGVALSGSGSDRTLILTPAADQTGSTQVTIRVSDGVVEVTEVFTLTVRSNPGLALKIPTAFTPNNDGVNDTWEIGNLEQHPDAVIHVFNRGGREVFSSTGYANPWDGTWNGKALPFGIYYFIVNLSDQASYKGTVMILD